MASRRASFTLWLASPRPAIPASVWTSRKTQSPHWLTWTMMLHKFSVERNLFRRQYDWQQGRDVRNPLQTQRDTTPPVVDSQYAYLDRSPRPQIGSSVHFIGHLRSVNQPLYSFADVHKNAIASHPGHNSVGDLSLLRVWL